MTLYRIDEAKMAGASDLFRDFMHHQIDQGVLVPAEPDYEAAWEEWKATGNIEDAVDAAFLL